LPWDDANRRGWVCEHRWEGVAGLIGFRKACRGLPVTQTWSSAQPDAPKVVPEQLPGSVVEVALLDCEAPAKRGTGGQKGTIGLQPRSDNRHPTSASVQTVTTELTIPEDARAASKKNAPTPKSQGEVSFCETMGGSDSLPPKLGAGPARLSGRRESGNGARSSLRSTTSSRSQTEKKEKIAWKMAQEATNDNFVVQELNRLLHLLGIREILEQLQDSFSEFLSRAEDRSRESRMANAMNSHSTRFVLCCVILLNALFIGAHTHVALRAEIENETLPDWWTHLELAFTIWFTVELLLRIIAERVLFLFGDDRWWNALDTFLVTSSWATMVTASAPSLTVARMLRIMRFTRIFRVLRALRTLQNFRIMILAIVQSFGTLVWVFVVLVFFMFFFAMMFMHGATEYFKDEGLHSEVATHLKELFGDLPYSLLTLFEAITGGRDWHDVVPTLLAMHTGYVITFVVYIFFMMFLVLNVVVGGVVKTTSEVYKRDKQLIVQEEQGRLRRYCEEIKGFFRQADQDESGTLTWEEFSKYLHDDKVKAYFQTLELDISQAHVLFTLLDSDESNEVAIDEFVDGCMRLKGQARSIDVNFLLYEIDKTLLKVESFAISVEDNVMRIEEYMRAQNPTMSITLTPHTSRDAKAKELRAQRSRRGRLAAGWTSTNLGWE